MSSIEIVPYTAADKQLWDEFVSQSNNGTLFHKQSFLAYHPEDRFIESSLLFYKSGRLLAVLPAARRPGDGENLLVSHPGASFGGFVVKGDLSLKNASLLVEALISHGRENQFSGIDITSPPCIYLQMPSQYLDFALYLAGFHYRKREVSSIIQLPASKTEVLAMFKPEARTAVRRAEKLGVTVRMDDNYEAFYQILEKNLKLRHDVIPTHSLPELQELVRRFPDEIVLFSAYVENELAAGIVLFHANAKTTLAFYISHSTKYQKYRVVNYLFYHVFCWCLKKGFRFLDFGLFTVNMEPNWGLGRFKESFGAQGVFRESFRFILK